MIQRDKILQQLQSKRDQFVAYEDSFQDEAVKYHDALERMAMLPSSELTRKLATVKTPGALPTAEFDAATAALKCTQLGGRAAIPRLPEVLSYLSERGV